MLFVSKPQLVEAVQWTGDNWDEINAAIGRKVHLSLAAGEEPALRLKAGKGGAQEWVPVPIGHWLVHPLADTSDIWPVEDVYFREKYSADAPGSNDGVSSDT